MRSFWEPAACWAAAAAAVVAEGGSENGSSRWRAAGLQHHGSAGAAELQSRAAACWPLKSPVDQQQLLLVFMCRPTS